MEEEKKEIVETKKVEETNTPPQKNRKGLCIAALVLGIVALVFCCVWFISIPCGILAVIFGILGIKTPDKGMAIAGLVTGSIGLAISIVIIMMIFIYGFAEGYNDAYNSYYRNRNNRNYYNSSIYD